jgi:ABC-type polysaccharide/polyol phosphate transport system ATPase subunit
MKEAPSTCDETNISRVTRMQERNDIALQTIYGSKIFNSAAGSVVALKDAYFAIRKGKFVSIVGPPVANKSL